jgi:hypothetical protein
LRSVAANRDADLMWLRREFDLTDVQFQRIQALHTASLRSRRLFNPVSLPTQPLVGELVKQRRIGKLSD